jgi:AcrR family transcriptional regulator
MTVRRSVRRDRRQELLTAASHLFVTQGYHATSMDDIAKVMRLNKGTLYYYYESKANLLFDILLRVNRRYLEAVKVRDPGLSPADAVRSHIETTVKYVLENLDDTRLNQQEFPFLDRSLSRDQANLLKDLFREIESYQKKLVSEAIESGQFRDVEPRVIAEMISGMVSWLPRWFKIGGKYSVDDVAAGYSGALVDGLLAGPAGRQQAPVRRRKAKGQVAQ